MSSEELIRNVLGSSQIQLVHRLIMIEQNKDMSAEARQIAALKAVLAHLHDIPILNARGSLLNPLQLILNSLVGNVVSGGKDAPHYELKMMSEAVVNVMHANGTTKKEARKFVADTLTTNGRPVTPETVRDWATGGKSRDHIVIVKGYEAVMVQHVPLKQDPDLTPMGRAKDFFTEQAAFFAR
ncbi:hypothetical protein [Ruegeria profundi]|uniref:hypothetical protein n=1 Tax=Ruegeria profundi TaxID=1685378 RepID=UPI001CD2673F|nr:hypothetical protein [Ruegeria profundi]MCA0930185.1 hypothetical protein [Ruegeria profundi]